YARSTVADFESSGSDGVAVEPAAAPVSRKLTRVKRDVAAAPSNDPADPTGK
ncbi:MAG: hypothetical protein JWQ73_1180, partial [Variovorax sp.]|nr:hypothetical protein [Variovorax sp.]